MTLSFSRFLPNLLVGALLTLPASGFAQAQAFSDQQRQAVEQIMKEYLLKNPEILRDAIVELERREQAAQKAGQQSALKQSRDLLTSSPRDMTAGNPSGTRASVTGARSLPRERASAPRSPTRTASRVGATEGLPSADRASISSS